MVDTFSVIPHPCSLDRMMQDELQAPSWSLLYQGRQVKLWGLDERDFFFFFLRQSS